MIDGFVNVTSIDDLTPGDTVHITAGKHTGYYELTRIDERNGEPILNLIPEAAWRITDPAAKKGHEIALKTPRLHYVRRVTDHAPACRTCGELWPCNHVLDAQKLENTINEIERSERKRDRDRKTREQFRARYSMESVCPACRQVVTTGQPFRTFDVNAVIANGPPVTYHLSRKCAADTPHHSMHDYLKRLKK